MVYIGVLTKWVNGRCIKSVLTNNGKAIKQDRFHAFSNMPLKYVGIKQMCSRKEETNYFALEKIVWGGILQTNVALLVVFWIVY
jgi:hypothetical protein